MNSSKLDKLVNQYINSSINSSGTITTTDGTTTYYPYGYGINGYGINANSFPYATATTATWSDFVNSEINKTMNTMPLILRVKNVSVDGNKIEVLFDRFSHKNWDKFLPEQGSVYFGEEIYGVYDKADYLYWEDTIKVQVEDIDSALKVIKKGVLFTTVNNFDERITNQEVFLFLKNIKAYKRYAHLILETLLDENKEPRNLKRRMEIHSELESRLV